VELREVAVEHDDVVDVTTGMGDARLAVEGDIDGHPLAPQPNRDGRCELLLILDDEHTHRLLRRFGIRRGGAASACLSTGYSHITISVAER
jgi:hypothetical protein